MLRRTRKIIVAAIIAAIPFIGTLPRPAIAAVSEWTQATASANWSARTSPEVLSFNGKIWLIGGFNVNSRKDVWSSTDGINWTQTAASTPWSDRINFRVVVYDNKMWIMSGTDNSFHGTSDVWSSTNGTEWTRVAVASDCYHQENPRHPHC